MAIVELYSKRQKRIRGEMPDVFEYENLPQPLRVQIVHIWGDSLGVPEYDIRGKLRNEPVNATYEAIVQCLCREYGLFRLPGPNVARVGRPYEQLVHFFLAEKDVDRLLDVVELFPRSAQTQMDNWPSWFGRNAPQKIATGMEEVNVRFREHGVGYQYANGEIIRVDSQLIHSEVVKPALRLLNQKHFAGAQEEFLKAHEHYRHGRAKEAMNYCLSSFESVMKAICDKHRWQYDKTAQARHLIATCLEKGLVPSFWESSLNSLKSLLEGSVPTGRNKMSGHGQGTMPVAVSDHVVAYMLHMTASAIVFLAESDAEIMPAAGTSRP